MADKTEKICYRCMEIHKAGNSKCPLCGFDITNPHIYPCKEKQDALPPGSILSNRYLTGCAILNDSFEIIYAGLDLYTEQKIFIHEFFPLEIVSRKTGDSSVSVISQEDKKIFQKGKKLYHTRSQRMKAEIPYSEQILSYHEENGTSYMVGKAYSFVSLKDMLHHKPFALYQEEYFSVLQALKNYLQALDAEGGRYYDIVPDRIIIGEEQVVILTGGREKYEFAESFSSKLILPDQKYSPPELAAGTTSYSKTADIYSFSILCYYIITSARMAEIKPHKKRRKAFQKKKLIGALKKYNIPDTLPEAIAAGIAENPDERGRDYSGYAVLNHYTSFPVEAFFQQSNTPNSRQNGKKKKSPFFIALICILAAFVLLTSSVYFLQGNKQKENSTPPSATIKIPAPFSLPTIPPTSTPTEAPTIRPTIELTQKPTKKPKATAKPKPTKRPVHTKKPIAQSTPKVTTKPTAPTVRPKITPKPAVKATKKPIPKSTLNNKEEIIEGIK